MEIVGPPGSSIRGFSQPADLPENRKEDPDDIRHALCLASGAAIISKLPLKDNRYYSNILLSIIFLY